MTIDTTHSDAGIEAGPRQRAAVAAKDGAESYFPQLDGMRAIAVIFVLLQHWVTNPTSIKAPFGFVGVTMFFVLSGYLISRILYQAKQRREERGISIATSLKIFYARRFLRIFPIYYLCVLVLWLIGYETVHRSIWWLLSYTQNYYFLIVGEDRLHTSHFWSLGIEEQYYFVYPLAVLLCSLSGRAWLLWGMVAVAFASRWLLDVYGVTINDNKYFTLSCFDSFALGGLLAHWEGRYGKERVLSVFRRPSTAVAVALVTLGFMALGVLLGDERSLRVVWFRAIVSIASLYVLGVALLNSRKNPLGLVMDNGAMKYIGKISYGVYLYHPYAPYMLAAVVPHKGWPLWVTFPIYSAITLAVSTASWFLIEKPFNGLKRYFKY